MGWAALWARGRGSRVEEGAVRLFKVGRLLVLPHWWAWGKGA